MTELSGETCEHCKQQIPEGSVHHRLFRTTKTLAADGTEQSGHPLALEFKPYCPACVTEYDKTHP